MYSHYFGFSVLQILRVLAIFRGFSSANTSGLAAFRGSILWIVPVISSSSTSGFCTAGIASTRSILSVGTACTASTRSTKILPICTAYSEYEVYLDHLCTVWILPPPFLQRRCTDGIYHKWELEKISVGEATGVSRVLTAFRE